MYQLMTGPGVGNLSSGQSVQSQSKHVVHYAGLEPAITNAIDKIKR